MAGYEIDDFDDDMDVLGESGAVVNGLRDRAASSDASSVDVVASRVSTRSNVGHGEAWNRSRGDWAFASLLALGYLAVVAAVFLGLGSIWSTLPGLARGVVGVAILSAAYGVALWPRFKDNAVLGRLFFTLGSIVYLLALALASPDFPTSWGSEGFWADVAETFESTTGRWAFGVFLMATFQTSRALQILVALATLTWISNSSSEYDPHAAIVVCVVGEYWAWRRGSRSVATIYAALCCWTLVSEPSLWRNPSSIAPLLVVLSCLAFWYGASYKSAWLRGAALILGGVALCASAFPIYWERTLPSAALASPTTAYLCSALPALGLVLFCSHMIFSGTNRSTPRFLLGVLLASSWTIGLVVVASTRFGTVFAAVTLLVAAALFFFLVFAERRFLANPAFQQLSLRASSRRPTTDGAEDDPEMNDLIDAETYATRATPIGASETLWRAIFQSAWNEIKKPAVYAIVLLQILLVLYSSR